VTPCTITYWHLQMRPKIITSCTDRQFAFSFLRQPSMWHCPHVLPSTMLGSNRSIPHACRVLSSKLAVKSKGSPYSITKCRFLAVSLQVTWVINPAVGCHYLPPGLQLPPQPLRGLLPILLLGEQRHNGCEQFAWQHCDCDLNPGPSAPESSTLTTRLPSHPEYVLQ